MWHDIVGRQCPASWHDPRVAYIKWNVQETHQSLVMRMSGACFCALFNSGSTDETLSHLAIMCHFLDLWELVRWQPWHGDHGWMMASEQQHALSFFLWCLGISELACLEFSNLKKGLHCLQAFPSFSCLTRTKPRWKAVVTSSASWPSTCFSAPWPSPPEFLT